MDNGRKYSVEKCRFRGIEQPHGFGYTLDDLFVTTWRPKDSEIAINALSATEEIVTIPTRSKYKLLLQFATFVLDQSDRPKDPLHPSKAYLVPFFNIASVRRRSAKRADFQDSLRHDYPPPSEDTRQSPTWCAFGCVGDNSDLDSTDTIDTRLLEDDLASLQTSDLGDWDQLAGEHDDNVSYSNLIIDISSEDVGEVTMTSAGRKRARQSDRKPVVNTRSTPGSKAPPDTETNGSADISGLAFLESGRAQRKKLDAVLQGTTTACAANASKVVSTRRAFCECLGQSNTALWKTQTIFRPKPSRLWLNKNVNS
ncbi:MAG: hypothetical protein Q9219_006666 [cf. Caloplaca sp. 3 TL-2023]